MGAKLARDADDSILKDRIAAIAGKPCSHRIHSPQGAPLDSNLDQRRQLPLQLVMVAHIQLYQPA